MPQNLEKSSAPQMMEIKTSYEPVVKKEVSSPPLGSPNLSLGEGPDLSVMASINPTIAEAALHRNILQFRPQQQIQQEMLLQEYWRQNQPQQLQLERLQQQLDERRHIKYLEEQASEEQVSEERALDEKLEAIKKKEKHEHSAVASEEVKQKLHDKILNKYRKNDHNAAGGPSSVRNWPAGHNLSGPEDFPYTLRKTASEPNISRIRLKQRMIERRSSPIVRRKDRVGAGAAQRRRQPLHADSASTPDSGQSSPPNGIPTSRSSSGSTPIHEEGCGSPYGPSQSGESCSDLSHPISSSLPSLQNISQGRPPHSSQAESSKLAMVSETEMVTAARAGMPITGHVLPSTLPNYPTLPVMDSEVCYVGGAHLRNHPLVAAIDPSSAAAIPFVGGAVYHIGGITPGVPISALSEAQQARLNRNIQRPLGRTQSAPLPLGHPMLQGATPPSFITAGRVAAAPNAQQHQYEGKLEAHPSNARQLIRQELLKRTGSKNHVENVEEETEASVVEAIASEKPEVRVIDLTDKGVDLRAHMYAHNPAYSREREPYVLKPPNLYSMVLPFAPRSGSHIARPLSRALSSPLVTLTAHSPHTKTHQESISISRQGAMTGLAYDSLMQKHQCTCGSVEPHPEHGGRIQAIWSRLQDTMLTHRCYRVEGRKATLEEIQSCHSEAHAVFFGTINRRLELFPINNYVRLPCGGIGVDSDTTYNESHTWSAATLAVGCALELSFKVASGELRNGYAVVRPPGHHAEYHKAMGFCYFNSVAITARQLQQRLHLDKILIVDWDVHHGNGTQSTFYADPHVLYLSLHRYDDGKFFPGTGDPSEVGEGDGLGFNVNVAWSGELNPPMGDAEYLAAFRTVVMPIAKDFNPDIVLVSAGFDAAALHPPTLGGYKVSPACFAHMTSSLMTLARGKVVLVLEGGYELEPISNCSEACVRALLGDELPPISELELGRRPSLVAVETLQKAIACQSDHWPVLRRNSSSVGLSVLEVKGREEEQETVSALASLRVDQHASHNTSPEPGVPPQGALRGHEEDEEPMEQGME